MKTNYWRTFCFGMLGLMLIFAKNVSAEELKIGDTASVPSWAWVEVKNLSGISNENCNFNYDDTCGVQFGGILTVIGFYDNETVLVRYSIDRKQFGTPCPDSTLFLMYKDDFLQLNYLTKRKQKTVTEERAKIFYILNNSIHAIE